MKTTVLICGHDDLLLKTRGWVLESAGYSVCLALNVSTALKLVGSNKIHFIVLCHTLNASECWHLLHAARIEDPTVRGLVLAANDSPCADSDADGVLRNFAGGKELISALDKLKSAAPFPRGETLKQPKPRGEMRLH